MKVGVAVLAFEASGTIVEVLDGVEAAAGDRIDALLVADDHSADRTVEVAREWAAGPHRFGAEVLRNERNLGYGANQKVAIRWAQRRGLDVLVLMHGDLQHLPAEVPSILEPVVEGRSDAVFGARTLVRGGARNGGMPLHRYWANRSLSHIQNYLADADFSEWHSGFRAYRLAALDAVSLDALPDWFDFDCAITLALLDAGARVDEVPCTTRYGDEVSRVKLIRYGFSVLGLAIGHRLTQARRRVPSPTAPPLEPSMQGDVVKP